MNVASIVPSSTSEVAQTTSNTGSWCSWPNTPPCHGGDRRFESGRARQIERVTPVVAVLILDRFLSL